MADKKHMSAQDRREFTLFCEQATDSQIENILKDETERAKREAAGYPRGQATYYETCRVIAKNEVERRRFRPRQGEGHGTVSEVRRH